MKTFLLGLAGFCLIVSGTFLWGFVQALKAMEEYDEEVVDFGYDS